jgi:hypothetical protein
MRQQPLSNNTSSFSHRHWKQGRAITNKKEGKGAKQILVDKRAQKEKFRSWEVSKLAVFQKKRGFFSIQCG